MMAREINNLLQSEYVDTGIVDFNFHCSVFDEGTDMILLPVYYTWTSGWNEVISYQSR